jgi:type IV fimbrial biogenesis protein FimT
MRKTDGFTLMELMVIVAVIAIAATVSVASYSRLVESTRLTTAANDLKGDLGLAKLTAVKNHMTVLAYFDDGTGQSGSYTLWGNAKGDTEILTRTMPGKVAIDGPAAPITFNTMGLCPLGGSVTVGVTDPVKQKTISVSVAGSITLSP